VNSFEKVLIDASFIREKNICKSIPIYTLRLIKAIPIERRNGIKILVQKGVDLNKYVDTEGYSFVEVKTGGLFSKVPKLKHIDLYKNYMQALKNTDWDAILITSDLAPYTLFKTKKRKVVVIHDLKAIKGTSQIRNKYSRFFYSRFMKTADKVIAISRYTKEDILSHYDIPENKITIVYNSVCLTSHSVKPTSFEIQGKYILWVNTLQEYKNIFTMLKAFRLIANKTNHHLVVVGRPTDYWNKKMLPYIENNGLSDRVFLLSNLTDEELKYLYENASLFVTTSTREGFGYTPIEAAMCCCPVISTRCEALGDTTQNMLNYYEPPYDETRLSEAIMSILKNPPTKENLQQIKSTFENLYTPNVQADSILRILQYEK